jgi:hypothetical protein
VKQYSPEELVLLRRIFDQVVHELPPAERTSSARSQIARRILSCAATGERNPVELRMAASVHAKECADAQP